jgi:hypothetical protein
LRTVRVRLLGFEQFGNFLEPIGQLGIVGQRVGIWGKSANHEITGRNGPLVARRIGLVGTFPWPMWSIRLYA